MSEIISTTNSQTEDKITQIIDTSISESEAEFRDENILLDAVETFTFLKHKHFS